MKNRELRFLIVQMLLMLFSITAYANITGTVYAELPVNGNVAATYGQMDSSEQGVSGVSVTGTDQFGISVTAITVQDGTYSLIGLNGKVRIVFSGWASYLEEGFDGNNKNSSIRFVNDGDTVNFGLHDPSDFSQANPKTIVPISYNGDPLGGGTAANAEVLKAFNYDGSGTRLSLSKKAKKYFCFSCFKKTLWLWTDGHRWYL